MRPSAKLAEHFDLLLSERWAAWFDEPPTFALPGEFTRIATVAELCADDGSLFWSGFMPPDVLPILGNDYGDWICARVTTDNQLGEVLHWYHGGGDWIPLGDRIECAILHDAIDQLRPKQHQMMRSTVEHLGRDFAKQVAQRLANPACFQWLLAGLSAPDEASELSVVSRQSTNAGAAESLQRIVGALEQEQHAEAILELYAAGWAIEASVCDRLELLIGRLNPLLSTSPDSADERWGQALEMCRHVASLRQDLLWVFDVAGRACLAMRLQDDAIEWFRRGLFASAFSDQGVRLRTQVEQAGASKYSVQQLLALEAKTDDWSRDEGNYLECYRAPSEIQVREQVVGYWRQRYQAAAEHRDWPNALQLLMKSFTDLGPTSLTHIADSLRELHAITQQASYPALTRLIGIHLARLGTR